MLQKDDEEEAELWRGKVQAFRNLYGFLSQVIPVPGLGPRAALRLPAPPGGEAAAACAAAPAYQFDDEVRLEYYRLQKISEGSISLEDGEAQPLDGPTEVGTGLVRERAGAALAAHRPRQRALRHRLQPGRPALLRPDRRGRDDRRRACARRPP